MGRADRRAAAYPLSPASIAPDPSPCRTAQATNRAQTGARANPTPLAATSPVLAASSRPIPRAVTTRPEKKLDRKYPHPDATNTRPRALWCRPKWSRTDGHVTPITASGRPRLTNPTYARTISRRLGFGGSAGGWVIGVVRGG